MFFDVAAIHDAAAKTMFGPSKIEARMPDPSEHLSKSGGFWIWASNL